MLKTSVDTLIFRDIAELGENGVDAGPAVMRSLDSDDFEERLLAAKTLGYIKYLDAVPKLVSLLNDKTDVRMSYVAAESLGRMKSKNALTSLKKVAANHWYPITKETAKKAIQHIQNGKVYDNTLQGKNFAFYYFDTQLLNIESCDEVTSQTVREPLSQKLYISNSKEQLEKLKYKSVVISYGACDEEQQKVDNPNGIIEVNASNIVEHRKSIYQTPQIALKIEDGWLVGSDSGEWGGELVHISSTNEHTILLKENVEDIYKLGERYIATTGLAHLSMNDGVIYELYKDKSDNWKNRPWRILPGAPRTSWFVDTGELLINTVGGGSILLSKDGNLRMAKCKQ